MPEVTERIKKKDEVAKSRTTNLFCHRPKVAEALVVLGS